jgi:hypothetical protein
VEQQHKNFEELKPHHNTQRDQISKLLTRQILGFELPKFVGDEKSGQLSSQHTIGRQKIAASQRARTLND